MKNLRMRLKKIFLLMNKSNNNCIFKKEAKASFFIDKESSKSNLKQLSKRKLLIGTFVGTFIW